jgi:hypothetical protein
MALVLVSTWGLAFAVETPPLQTEFPSDDGSVPLIVDWAGPLTPTEISVSGREILLHFAAPLAATAAQHMPKRLPSWVDGVSLGYDTLLVVAKHEQDFDVIEGDGWVIVDRIVPKTAPTDTPSPRAGQPSRNSRPTRRVERLQARYLAVTGQSGQAVQVLDRLVREDPRDVESLVQLAQVDSQRGKWRRAVKNFEQALSIKPGMIAAEREKIRLEKEYGPQARLDFDYQKVKKGDRQFIVRFTARAQASERLEVGTILENRWLKVDNAQRPSGLQTPINEDRQRGEIYGTWEHKGPRATRIALLAGPSSLGVQADHMIRHGGDAQSRVTLTFAKPYWELVEGLVDGGTIDEIEARHERPLGPRFFVVVQGALANYSLKDEDRLAQTIGGGGELYYRFKNLGPVRAVGYGLDADYLLNRKTRLVPDLSDGFFPMPVPTQEFHSFNLAIEDRVGEHFEYAIYSGYSYDRFGGKGPFVNGTFAYSPVTSVEMGGRITHAQTSGRGTEGSFILGGAYALWRF